MSVLQRTHPGRLLRRSKSVDDGGGCVKYDINEIRPRSSDYSTGDSMDSSNVSTSTDVAGSPDVFVHGPEPFCNASQPNISENWEDATTVTDGNDGSNSESSSSSYMAWTADVGMLPDFDALQSSSSSYMAYPADVDMLPDFDALLGKPLQTPVSVSDIDHTIDENDVLMREYCRDIERNHIFRMINACESLEAMEEYVIEHELETGLVDVSMITCIDEAICQRLQMAAQCDCQQDCLLLPCIQGQRELSSITRYLEMLRAASSDVSIETQMLHCLADHGAGCYEEMRCTMPWCLFFMESLSLYSRYKILHIVISMFSHCCVESMFHLVGARSCAFSPDNRFSINSYLMLSIHLHFHILPWTSFKAKILADDMLILYLRKTYFSGQYDMFNQSTEQCSAIQLQDGMDYNTSSCQVVARLTLYTDVFLAFGLTMNPIATPTYCVIKRFPSSSCVDDLTELLRNLNHPHIVTHHWLLPQLESKAVFICTEFHGDSLCEWLRRKHPHGCSDLSHIRMILTHVLSAVQYLHGVNVLYLAWTGSDVALGCHSDNMIFAKLCDFSHAVSMEDELTEEDEEDIRQLLLPAILPPEETLSLQFSDQWGLGCLLHEIAIGRKVHNAFVHDEPKRQREHICALQRPDLTELDRIHPTVASLIRDCLQLDASQRPSIESLQQRVETLVSV